jgi:hypothetical protein
MSGDTGWLSKLDFARWWKVLIAVGVAFVLGALIAKDVAFQVIGLGIVASGFGEWMNHRMEMEPRHGGVVTSFERKNRFIGVFLDVVGVILILTGLNHLLRALFSN